MNQSDLLVQINQQKITNHYKFVRQLGRGASGVCYKASSKSNPSNMYCIKQLLKKTKNVERLTKQIYILDQLSHPGIVRLYQVFEDCNSIYLVLQLCEGGQLFDYLEWKETFSERQAKEIFSQMLCAIKYCHEMNIIHRDLKPENFVLAENPKEDELPQLKLIDFDLAFKWEEDPSKEIMDKEGHKIIGSPYYIAPEVIEGNYNEKCDIWAAGVILYMMISGVPPFDGETNKQILDKIMKGNYSLQFLEMKGVSTLLRDLIKKILKPEGERITIEGIFNHPWMQIKPKTTPIPIDFSYLLKFSKFSKLKEIAATYLASQLTSKQTKKIDRIFKEIDRNRDGFLSTGEIKKAFDQRKSKNLQVQFQLIFNFVEHEKEGALNYNEFVASMLNQQEITSKQKLRQVFNVLDKDGNGYIQKDELNSILQKFDMKRKRTSGQHLQEDVQEIFKKSDKNGDGRIDFEQFVDTICENFT